MSIEFHKQTPYKEITPDVEHIRILLTEFINGPDQLCLVSGRPTHGMLLASAQPGLVSRDLFAAEFAWWVQPDYRGKDLSDRFLRYYEFWAKEVGCKYVTVSSLENEYADALGRFYERKGYQKTENAFIKVI